ncbi:MAG: hypothetical protein IJ142_00880 [Bacteroidaceae bacterium]|nr:hypothetical protein [Bacteroidaceae bacterium]
MDITLHISDADYRDLLSAGRRMRGSIGVINAKEATFNRHHPEGRPKAANYRFCRLTHGRVSVSDERVRMTLCIDRSEAAVCASECIDAESAAASNFVFNEIESNQA